MESHKCLGCGKMTTLPMFCRLECIDKYAGRTLTTRERHDVFLYINGASKYSSRPLSSMEVTIQSHMAGGPQLFKLISEGSIEYRPEMDRALGSSGLEALIRDGLVSYEPRLNSVLGGAALQALIEHGRLRYEEQMNDTLGGHRLASLMAMECIDYQPHMDAALGWAS